LTLVSSNGEDVRPYGARASEDEPTARMPGSLVQETLRESLLQYYSAWPDVALSELGGLTPRESVMTVPGRRRVELMIRDLEEKAQTSGIAFAYSFDNLRRDLGILAPPVRVEAGKKLST
jgi:hypothetical protein